MSGFEYSAISQYIREARLQAGYASREMAAMKLPYSPETIGRHERGETLLLPGDIIQYADGYNSKDLPIRYCVSSCAIGRFLGRSAEERELPHAAIRLHNGLDDVQSSVQMLMRIAYNGVVNPNEKEDFYEAVSVLNEFEHCISDMALIAYKEKSRPAGTEATVNEFSYNHCTSARPGCQGQFM